MGENTKIEWADHSWNPCLGCDPVHTGCRNCYAQDYFKRFGIIGKRRKTSAANWRKPLGWNKIGLTGYECPNSDHTASHITECERCVELHRPRVFPSLCDPFEDWPGPIVNAKGQRLWVSDEEPGRYPPAQPWAKLLTCEQHNITDGVYRPATMDDLRRDMFSLIDQTPNLDWLLLTKRPGNIRRMIPPIFDEAAARESIEVHTLRHVRYRPNIHLLYSASDQETLEAGIGHLLECRDLSPVLGFSLEPLTGPIDLGRLMEPLGMDYVENLPTGPCGGSPIDWVIVGGESGPNARTCQIEWIWSIVKQCEAAGVPCFVKQLGSNATKWDKTADGLGGVTGGGGDLPWVTDDKKGGDWSEWPEALKVRQYPEVKP